MPHPEIGAANGEAGPGQRPAAECCPDRSPAERIEDAQRPNAPDETANRRDPKGARQETDRAVQRPHPDVRRLPQQHDGGQEDAGGDRVDRGMAGARNPRRAGLEPFADHDTVLEKDASDRPASATSAADTAVVNRNPATGPATRNAANSSREPPPTIAAAAVAVTAAVRFMGNRRLGWGFGGGMHGAGEMPAGATIRNAWQFMDCPAGAPHALRRIRARPPWHGLCFSSIAQLNHGAP